MSTTGPGTPGLPSAEVSPIVLQPEAKISLPQTHDFLKLPETASSSAKEQDIGLVTLAIIGQKGNALLKEDFKAEKINPDSLKSKYKNDHARGEVTFLSYLMRSDFQGTALKGQDMTINLDGKDQKVNQIFGRSGNQFQCEVAGQVVLVNCEQILSVQITSAFSNENVRKLFTPDELKIVDAYLDTLTGGKQGLVTQVEEGKLRELALNSGLISSESVIVFANANKKEVNLEDLKEGVAEDKAKTATANQEYNQKIDEALKLMEEKTVASPEAVSAVCQIIIPDNIQTTDLIISTQIAQIEQQIAELKITNPQDLKLPELENKQAELIRFGKLIQDAQQFFAQGHAIENFFGQVQRGEIDSTTVQKLDTALKENNSQAILESLLTDKNISDENKKKLKIPSGVKIFGGASLAIIFMLFWKGLKGEGGMMPMSGAGR